MATQLDDRQMVNRAALSALGNSANRTLDLIMGDINTFFANATFLPTASVLMKRDANANTQANSFIANLATTATANGTTTLVVGSAFNQIFTGTLAQTVVLPAANTLTLGQQFYISNQSTASIQINANGGGGLQLMSTATHLVVTVTDISTGPGVWDLSYTGAPGGTVQVYPTVFAGSESSLSAAISTCAAGGVICVYQAFTVSTASYTIPAGCILLGRDAGSIITLSGSGALVLASEAIMRDIQITTALSSGTLVTLSNSRSTLQTCKFSVPSNSTTVCVNVTGSSNLIQRCVFTGVLGPSTGVGIQYTSGSNNMDKDCLFLT